MAELQPGTSWGPFRIENVLGRGPDALLYRAVRSSDSRPVTLKIFGDDLDAATLSRFEDDTRRVIGLNHPNVLRVESVGRENGLLTVATERFDGRSLRTYSAQSLRESVDFLLKASRGLGAAWMRLILHRNLKPENILISSSGDVKLTDFGQFREPTAYWSPERLKGQSPDLRGELYALGAIFKEIVPPGNVDIDALLKHMTRIETFERVQMVEEVISRLEIWLSRSPAPGPAPTLATPPRLPPTIEAPEPDPIPPPPEIPDPTPMPSTMDFPDPALDSAREDLVRTLAAIPARISRTLTAPAPAPVDAPPSPPVFMPPPPPIYVPPPLPPIFVPPSPPPPPPPKPARVEIAIPPPPIRPAAKRRSGVGGVLKTLLVFGAILGLVVYQNRARHQRETEIDRLTSLAQQDQAKARKEIEERVRTEKATEKEKDLLTKIKREEWEQVRAKIRKLDGDTKYTEALEECDRYLQKAGAKPPGEAVELRKSLKDWVSMLSRAESSHKNGSDRMAYEFLARAEATRPKEVQAIQARWCDEDWKKTKAALDKAASENDPDSALLEIDRFLKKPHQGGRHKGDAEARGQVFQADVDYADLAGRVENLRARAPADAVAALEAFLAKPHQGGTHRDEVEKQLAKIREDAKATLYSGRTSISRMAISPDGKRIAFTADGVRILDLATREEIWNAPVKSLQKAIWLGSDDRLITASTTRITLWNVAKKTEVRSVAPTIGYFIALAASADAKVVVGAQSDGSLWIWNPAGEEPARLEKEIAAGAMALALTPDGATVAIGGRDRSVRIRELSTGKEMKWVGPSSTVMALALSSDGKRLLAGSANGLVSLWNAETGESARDITGHTGNVTGVAFSPDGASMASGGLDSLIRVCPLKDGAPFRELKGHRGRISALAFLPDGGLVSSGADGSVRIWPKE